LGDSQLFQRFEENKQMTNESASAGAFWPEWLMSHSESVRQDLIAINNARVAIEMRQKQSWTYRIASREQYNALYDGLIGATVLKSVGQDQYEVNKAKLGLIQQALSRRNIAVIIHDNGNVVTAFTASLVRNTIIVAKLIRAAQSAFNSEDMVTGLTLIRSILEQIADLNSMVSVVTGLPEICDFNGALKALEELSNEIHKKAYATRVDWEKVITTEFPLLKNRKEIEYKPEPNRVNQLAETILKSIDKLDHSIKGTRLLYEFLCEFAHPNVGTLWAITENHRMIEDSDGVIWNERQLGWGPPVSFMQACNVQMSFVFSQLSRILELHAALLDGGEEQKKQILRLVQIIIRTHVRQHPKILSPYAQCPCNSGKKLKFCCAQKIR
jgi:hypothetical protein